MKNTLLTTVAVAALLAGTGLASAQAVKSERAPAAQPPAAQQPAAPEVKAQDNKSQPQPNKPAAQNTKPQPGTTGQATPNVQRTEKPAAQADKPAAQTAKPQPGTTGQSTPSAQRNEPPAAQNNQRSNTPAAQNTEQKPNTAAQAPAHGSVALSADQKTKIRTTVLQGSNAPRVTNVNFSINVGTVVPRTVHVVPVPATLVEIHPAWRGYMYFIVGEQIIVVEPRTLQIVEVIVI